MFFLSRPCHVYIKAGPGDCAVLNLYVYSKGWGEAIVVDGKVMCSGGFQFVCSPANDKVTHTQYTRQSVCTGGGGGGGGGLVVAGLPVFWFVAEIHAHCFIFIIRLPLFSSSSSS